MIPAIRCNIVSDNILIIKKGHPSLQIAETLALIFLKDYHIANPMTKLQTAISGMPACGIT